MNLNCLKARVSRKASPTWLMVSYCSLLLTADPRAQVAMHGWKLFVCGSLPIFGLEVYPTCVFLVCAHARSVSHTFACEYINKCIYMHVYIYVYAYVCLCVCIWDGAGVQDGVLPSMDQQRNWTVQEENDWLRAVSPLPPMCARV